MASPAPLFGSPAGTKRAREADDDIEEPSRKWARPTLNVTDGGDPWAHDSVISTPTASVSQVYHQQRKYDSDEQSSMVSEPGTPQDISMSSDDEDIDLTSFSKSSEDSSRPNPLPPSSPWRERVQNRNRVPTPFTSTRRQPMPIRTGPQQHVRSRHPAEIMSSDGHLDVPSPIDEDEVPTPPSAAAAEAAGSQLSMLSVNDMDIESSADLPTITLHPARSSTRFTCGSTPDFEPMDSGTEHVLVAKRRQRSGAQSNGSVSPGLGEGEDTGMTGPRGFSMGFRPDCEKCRMRMPGHMNHFIV